MVTRDAASSASKHPLREPRGQMGPKVKGGKVATLSHVYKLIRKKETTDVKHVMLNCFVTIQCVYNPSWQV